MTAQQVRKQQQIEEQDSSYTLLTTDIIAMITRGHARRHMQHGNIRLAIRDGKIHSLHFEEAELVPQRAKLTRRDNITVLGDRS